VPARAGSGPGRGSCGRALRRPGGRSPSRSGRKTRPADRLVNHSDVWVILGPRPGRECLAGACAPAGCPDEPSRVVAVFRAVSWWTAALAEPARSLPTGDTVQIRSASCLGGPLRWHRQAPAGAGARGAVQRSGRPSQETLPFEAGQFPDRLKLKAQRGRGRQDAARCGAGLRTGLAAALRRLDGGTLAQAGRWSAGSW
jgi:hypothetical protein